MLTLFKLIIICEVSMNLHEECLLKYLINPLDLFYTTELLKHNNNLIEEKADKAVFFKTQNQMNYTVSRI